MRDSSAGVRALNLCGKFVQQEGEGRHAIVICVILPMGFEFSCFCRSVTRQKNSQSLQLNTVTPRGGVEAAAGSEICFK
jgi:hypothetical protein